MQIDKNKRKTTQQSQPNKPPMQPGQRMYESGIIYFSDHFFFIVE